MSETIYLYKSHREFQPGQTRLQKGAVFETNYLVIIGCLCLVLIFFWFLGSPLRQQIQFWQNSGESIGAVTSCRYIPGKGGYTLVSFTYEIVDSEGQSQSYTGKDSVSFFDECDAPYTVGTSYPVYYIKDNPQEAGIGSFMHTSDYIGVVCYSFFALGGLVWVFNSLLKNLHERRKYQQLSQTKIIIEGRIMELGESHASSAQYKFAKYHFQTPGGYYINGRIESRNRYLWPERMEPGDTIWILYVDDKTYCVL